MVQYLKIDEQTISDLSIFGRPGKASVYDLYNTTITQGGAAKLKALFRHPLAEERLINERVAHMGFPVAADSMQFSVMEGMFTSINVPDDISLGWSHFYAEVMRVKLVAKEVSSGKRLFVLFDELFKGTNVKDAYDATLIVTQKLARYRSCAFVISTHIIEVGEALMGTPNIKFGYMPTLMKGAVPHYTYAMTSGITTDRQGMIIIENEKILEMLA